VAVGGFEPRRSGLRARWMLEGRDPAAVGPVEALMALMARPPGVPAPGPPVAQAGSGRRYVLLAPGGGVAGLCVCFGPYGP
jgi:hypothetical protein